MDRVLSFVYHLFRHFQRKWRLILLFLAPLLIFYICVYCKIILISDIRNWWTGDMVDFSDFNNKTGLPYFIVPNVIHFIRFHKASLSFVDYICIMAAYMAQKPDKIYIHTDRKEFSGFYWYRLRNISHVISLKRMKVPTHVFGRPISSLYHASDIARIQILMEHGGIFLDNDSYLVRSLDYFRKFEMAIGWPEGEFLGTQVLVAHKNSRFLKYWLSCYRWYKPRMWYYNAGQMPTEVILARHPELVHRVKEKFGVHMMVRQLYADYLSNWTEYYSIHLLSRHRPHLAADDIQKTGIVNFDENNIKAYRSTFGEMARLVYYGQKDILEKVV